MAHLSWISENLNVEGMCLMEAVGVEVLRKVVPWILAKGWQTNRKTLAKVMAVTSISSELALLDEGRQNWLKAYGGELVEWAVQSVWYLGPPVFLR